MKIDPRDGVLEATALAARILEAS